MDMQSIVFYLLALIILGSAVMTAWSTDLVHSALFMILTFVGIAGIYILLNADFLAMVQILIYVGAISVLLVFGIMLTRRGNMNESNLFNKYKLPGLFVAGLTAAVMILSILFSIWKLSGNNPSNTTVEEIAGLLMNEYTVPFEVAGILILISMIGAIIIGKGVREQK